MRENETKEVKVKTGLSTGVKVGIGISIGCLIVIIIIIVLFGFGCSNVWNEAKKQVGASQSASLTPAAQKTYQEVFRFEGEGNKKSEPFIITGNRFKIKYDCPEGHCGAYLYKTKDNLYIGKFFDSTDPIKDETIQYGAGEYYIAVIDASDWGTYTMIVEDYK